MALSAAANSLTNTDLLIISADQDAASLERAWFYVPRMLHGETLVLHEQPADEDPPGTQLVPVPRLDIEARAAAQSKARRRAA